MMKKCSSLRRGSGSLGILLACLVFLQPAAVSAAPGGSGSGGQESTTVTTQVPEGHLVEISADGGRIVCDGDICGESVRIERHKEQTYWILPPQGKRLKALYYNGEDVTGQVRDGVFTAPSLSADAELKAVFEDADVPGGQPDYELSVTVTDPEGNPAEDVRVEIGGTVGETGADGQFEVSGVPAGEHTVVVIDSNQKVIGHGTLVISPDEEETTLRVEMEIGEDGLISFRIDGVETPEPGGDGAKPDDSGAGDGSGVKTGDPGSAALWGSAGMAALAAGAAGWAWRRKCGIRKN